MYEGDAKLVTLSGKLPTPPVVEGKVAVVPAITLIKGGL